MKKRRGNILSRKELLQVTGGDGFSLYVALGGVATFIIGAVDGFFRPLKCR